jgi:hypothetical protein
MKDFFVDKFETEVSELERGLTEKEIIGLKRKAGELIDALCSKKLLIHDSGTYAMQFIVGPGPVYFDTFFQINSALKMLLSFIEEEDCFLDLHEGGLPDNINYLLRVKEMIQDSFRLFSHFFHNDKEEQERIRYSIRNLRWMYSREGILRQIEGLFESIDEQLSYLSGLLQDLKSDDYLNLIFGQERNILEAGINQLLAEKSAEKAIQIIQGQIKENYVDFNAYLDVFKPNGFRLFDYLMKNHLSSGIGKQSDVSFFYRMMEDRDKLIHANQKRFKLFLEERYPNLEPMGKFKVWNDINSEKRMQIYLAAKNAIGLK